MTGRSQLINVAKMRGNLRESTEDSVAIEEPLEIRLDFEDAGKRRTRSVSITMRTPGDDGDLVRGLLFTEGLVERPGDVTAVTACRDVPDEARGNVVLVSLREGAALDEERTARAGLVSSGCGVCGKTTLASIRAVAPPVGPGPALTPRRMGEMLFEMTGQPPRFRSVPAGLLRWIAGGLGLAGRLSPRLAAKAELARIGHYYATESMLVLDPATGRYDADATPETGTDTLADHYARLLRGEAADDRGAHAVF
mgnify:CR=1 FL=1